MVLKSKLTKKIIRNPTDEEFLKKLEIEILLNSNDIEYRVWFDDNHIGSAWYKKKTNSIDSIEIDEDFRRKGLATFLYNYIENDLNIKLQPDKVQTQDGKVFWKSRLKKNPSPKPKVKNARTLKTIKTKISR